jgi:hypothetical protein
MAWAGSARSTQEHLLSLLSSTDIFYTFSSARFGAGVLHALRAVARRARVPIVLDAPAAAGPNAAVAVADGQLVEAVVLQSLAEARSARGCAALRLAVICPLHSTAQHSTAKQSRGLSGKKARKGMK